MFLIVFVAEFKKQSWKEKLMIVVRHLNGDRFSIILIQMGAIFFIMGAIQIRKLNYSQISLQLLQKTFWELVKKNLGLTRWLYSCAVPIVFIAKTATWGLSAKCFKHKHKMQNFLPELNLYYINQFNCQT